MQKRFTPTILLIALLAIFIGGTGSYLLYLKENQLTPQSYPEPSKYSLPSLEQSPTQTPSSPKPTLIPSTPYKISAEIYQKLSQEGKVGVIVTLSGSVEQILGELAFTQDEFKLTYKWENLSSFSGIAYKSIALDKLASHSKVKLVTLDKALKIQ